MNSMQGQAYVASLFPLVQSLGLSSHFVSAADLKTGAVSAKMTGPASRKRILLVDDEIDVSVIFKSGLERHGFTVEVYNDPREALANFKAGYYDLLLLDVRMPFMSGFELLKEMRKKDWHAKVCFISAYEVQDEDLAKHVPHENSPSIIKKPISIKDLVQRINRV